MHAPLVADGWPVNVKRVERLWRLAGLKIPPRRAKASGLRAGGTAENSAWALPALRANHVCSYDFVAAGTVDGGPLRIGNVADEYTRQAPGSHVARSIGARDVTVVLGRLVQQHRPPQIIRSDNGREFIAATVTDWLGEHGVTPALLAKASPQQNCYVERFNGSMRDELRDGEQLPTLLQARVVVADWIDEYNSLRPHRGLAMMTPDAVAAQARATVRGMDESACHHRRWTTSKTPHRAGSGRHSHSTDLAPCS